MTKGWKMIVTVLLLVYLVVLIFTAIAYFEANNKCVSMEKKIESLELEKDELINYYIDMAEQYKLENVKLKKVIDDLTDPVVPLKYEEEQPKERLPDCNYTNTFRYMDYQKITDKSSNQYRLQTECYTSCEGIRIYNGDRLYLCVALGSAYGQNIGDTWHVTLKCGTEFDIILADCKGDDNDGFGHSDVNYDGYNCINVIEFVVDEEEIPSAVKSTGTFSVFGYFGGLYGDGGNVVKMEYTGGVWR